MQVGQRRTQHGNAALFVAALFWAVGLGLPSLAAADRAEARASATERQDEPRTEPSQQLASRLLEQSGVRGGLVVHVGCGDGRLTVALRANDSFLVHGLDTDPALVQQARLLITRAGLYGPVSVDTFDGRHLPYIDQTVNLLVVEQLAELSRDELLRVLVPGGVALIRNGDGWQKLVKPRAAELDEWTHFLHGPDNNAVSQDKLVDFPFHIQWSGRPEHSRHHGIASSVHTMVSAGGRLFYVMDEGPTALPYHLPARWHLVARDAFNGVVLWRRPLQVWQPHVIKGRKSIAADLWRRLVATKDEVYTTLTIFGPVVALDAATGQLLRTYDGTERTEEIVFENGVLYLLATTRPAEAIDRRQLAQLRTRPDQKRLLAVDAATGRVLWTKQDPDTFGVQPTTLAVKDGRLCFQNTRAVVCLEATNGQVRWRFERPSPFARPSTSTPTLVLAEDVVLSADLVDGRTTGRRATGPTCELIALSAETGQELWRCPCAENVGAGPDVFVANGLVWVGENPRRASSDYNHGRDLHTGEIKKSFDHADKWPTWHHHRCYRDKATVKYILASRTGIEFIDLQCGKLTPHHWVRGVCEYGILPANGLIYTPPDQCACYQESKLHGFHALAPRRPSMENLKPLPLQQRLEKGPAYGKVAASEAAGPDQWPTFRHDNSRSNHVPFDLPPNLKTAWRSKLGGRLTTLVCANGRLYVARKDTHTVFCLDAKTGQVVWRYQAGGVVDSPPTVAGGLAVFGCRDGRVYAVRASDGQLVWRFLAAPVDRRLVENGQVASVWPVHGSVLVEDGCVYVVAGRSSYFDGGLYLYKLDLTTGKPLLCKNYYSRDPKTGERVDLYSPYPAELLPFRELPGLLPDIFSADRRRLFLRGVPLDHDLQILDRTYVRHLFSSMGFLEGTWWERTYWIYGVHFYGGARGQSYARTLFPAGRLLAFDSTSVFGYQDATICVREPGIFRTAKVPELVDVVSEVAARLKQGRVRGRKGRKVKPRSIDLDELRRLLVWKDGVPQNPQRVQLTALGAVGELIRRLQKYRFDWYRSVPLYPNALLVTDSSFWLCGPPLFREEEAATELATCPTEPYRLDEVLQEALDTFAGKRGGVLLAVDKEDGTERARLQLPSSPVFDGMIAAGRALFVALEDGSVVCLREQ